MSMSSLAVSAPADTEQTSDTADAQAPDNTQRVAVLYVNRFPGEADYKQRPYMVVWISNPTLFTPDGKCAQCAELGESGQCPGIESHLQAQIRVCSENHGQPVQLREYEITDLTNDLATARRLEEMLRADKENGVIGTEESDELEELADLLDDGDREFSYLDDPF